MADTNIYEGWVDENGTAKTAPTGFTNETTAKANITDPMPPLADPTHTGTVLKKADADTSRPTQRSDAKYLDIINESVVPMLQSRGYDFIKAITTPSQIVDFGKSISSLTASDIKDTTDTFIMGAIKTIFNEMTVELYNCPLVVDALRYGEITQSVYKTNVVKATESKAFHLVDGEKYDLETYHGFTLDNRVFSKDCSFRLEYSIPHTLYDYAFENEGKLNELYAYIQSCVADDMNEKKNGLLLVLYQSIIETSYNKRYRLITKFNEYLGKSGQSVVTLNDIVADEELMRQFTAFYKTKTTGVRRGMAKRSTKYNDGTVLSVTPKSRNVLLEIAQFNDILNNNVYSMHNPIDLPSASLVDFWQSDGDELAPTLEDCSSITINHNGTVTNYPLVVAIALDKKRGALMVAPSKTTMAYNGNGDFTTYYDYYTSRMCNDERANCVIFTLD